MRKKSRLITTALATAVLAVSACAGSSEPGPTPEHTRIVPDEPGRGDVDDATIELEFAVYQALEYDPYEKATRYYPDAHEVVVTIWTYGDVLPRQRLEELYERAQAAADGAHVRLTLVDNDGNSEDWAP